jgi:aminomethyltransferase
VLKREVKNSVTESLHRSPLHNIHKSCEAKFAEFGGWLMPLSYTTGTLQEHKACRAEAAIFDVSHLGTLRVTGGDAFQAIQETFTNDLDRINPGKAQYTHLLNDSGGVIDDVIIWWIEKSEFEIMPNASNTERVRLALERFQGEVYATDTTDQRAVIAVQGPKAQKILEKVSEEFSLIQRFSIGKVAYKDRSLTAAGTGYTGEDGLEISAPLDVAEELWSELVNAGAIPAGLGARDTLRLEAALPLHGNELSAEISPIEANLKWVVAMEKTDFIGKSAIENQVQTGVRRKLFGIVTNGRRPPRSGQPITKDAQEVGVITSGNYSPMLECGIALAMLPPKTLVGDKVMITGRSGQEEATVTALPFYKVT